MSLQASDFKRYGAAVMPEDDSTSNVGGAISTTKQVNLGAMSANGTITVVSDSSGDTTQTLTVTGRLASGSIDTDALALNGTTPVNGTKTFERVLKLVLSASCAGTITVTRTGSETIATMVSGLLQDRRMFYDAVSAASAKNIYEKFFWKNTHGTLTLNAAKMKMTAHVADPDNGMQIAIDSAKDGNTTASNRVTAPASGIGSFVDDGTDLSLPGNTLEAGSGIGVWIKMGLGANDAAFKGSFTTQISGTTT